MLNAKCSSFYYWQFHLDLGFSTAPMMDYFIYSQQIYNTLPDVLATKTLVLSFPYYDRVSKLRGFPELYYYFTKNCWDTNSAENINGVVIIFLSRRIPC